MGVVAPIPHSAPRDLPGGPGETRQETESQLCEKRQDTWAGGEWMSEGCKPTCRAHGAVQLACDETGTLCCSPACRPPQARRVSATRSAQA